MKVMVTGFEPFGGEIINPALEILKKLPTKIDNVDIVKVELPTVFSRSIETLEKALELNKPDILLSIGQAGGRMEINVEKVGINLQDASIPDNDGKQPTDMAIFKNGETAYFTNLPVKRMVEEVKKAGIPACISYSAGTYVCNNILYAGLYFTYKKYPNMKSGFVHVPFIPQQVIGKRSASMSLDDMIKAIEIMIKTAIANNDDISVIGGITH